MSLRLRPWMFVSAAWIAPAILAIASRVAQARLWGSPTPDTALLVFESLDWLIYGLFAPLIFAISSRWPLTGAGTRRGAWIVHSAAAIAFCAAWAIAGTALKGLLGTDSFDRGVGVSLMSWFLITLPFGTGTYFGMVAIEHAIRHFTSARQWEAHAARVDEQLTEARLAALQARLNPHFLFNALNTVSVLVREGDTAQAEKVVDHLSAVLRRTLARENSAEVPLGQELGLVREYLAVERARFSDRLHPTFSVADELHRAAVPPFAVQHLVENAIRHGIASRSDAGRVHVQAERDAGTLTISVEDDGVGIGDGAESPGHGLARTRERIRALYGPRASLIVRRSDAGKTIASLHLPYNKLPLGEHDDG